VTGALRRILVIEDDAETAKQIVDFLTTRGYEANLAVDGDEGVRLGESAEYRLRSRPE
jgi:two-component system, OmpR family, response regulator